MNVNFHPLRQLRDAVGRIGDAVNASEEYSRAMAGGDTTRLGRRGANSAASHIPL
ncbi:MAG: hypothetical protein WC048_12375 [Rhizobium sp.]